MKDCDPKMFISNHIAASMPKSPIGANERVTYSRTKNKTPKNTLYTIYDRANEVIFFGIARCNMGAKADTCVKSIGRNVAQQRAVMARDAFKDTPAQLILHADGLHGKVHKDLLVYLMDYFFSLDRSFDLSMMRLGLSSSASISCTVA